MRPASFRYFAPASVEEALGLLAQHGDEARLLAGGQSLVPLMNLRMVKPGVLIDLNRCAELAYVEERDDCIAYGPMTRQIDAESDPLTAAHCRLVAEGLRQAGPPAVRNRATVGGTLAHADRTAELPGVAAALEARLVVEGNGVRREVTAANFFAGDLATDLKPGEMLREVRFPRCAPGARCFFAEVGVRRRDMVLAGVAACLEPGPQQTFRAARLAVVGVEAKPLRLAQVEAELIAAPLNRNRIPALAREAAAAVEPADDVHASAAYRRRAVGALVSRILEQAIERDAGARSEDAEGMR